MKLLVFSDSHHSLRGMRDAIDLERPNYVIHLGDLHFHCDIPKELIVQRLHIEDCGIVKCSEEQEDAVTMICSDVGQIGGSDEDNGIGDIIKTAMGGIKGVLETKIINAADYVL